MGQIEVYNWLYKAGKKDDRYYTIKEVTQGLQAEGLSNGSLSGVPQDLLRLSLSGYLDSEVEGNIIVFKRLFKLKQKYLLK